MKVFLKMVSDELFKNTNKINGIKNSDYNMFMDKSSHMLNDLSNINNYTYTVYFRPTKLHTKKYYDICDKICNFVLGGNDTICMQTVSDANYNIKLTDEYLCEDSNNFSIEYQIIARSNNISLKILNGNITGEIKKTPSTCYTYNIDCQKDTCDKINTYDMSNMPNMSFYIYNISNNLYLTIPTVTIKKDLLICLLIKSYLTKNKIVKKSFVS